MHHSPVDKFSPCTYTHTHTPTGSSDTPLSSTFHRRTTPNDAISTVRTTVPPCSCSPSLPPSLPPGDNKWGQLGREDNSTKIGDEPDEVGENLVGVQIGGTVSDMALGESHTCMLLESSGEVACFGKNDAGQLGLGDTEHRGHAAGDVGETVDFGAGLSAVAVTSGCEHTCALLDDGSVKCFGENNDGQLGQVRWEGMGSVG